MIEEYIKKNRSYRRFHESESITADQLEKWISLARYCSSGRNLQPLKYYGITEPALKREVFLHLAWAGYLPEWKGPAEGERPAAYIIVMQDKSIGERSYCDEGIAIQTILLGAVEDGYGGCIIGSVNRARVSKLLNLPGHLEILNVIALGKPAETVVIEDMKDNEVRYWRDENSIHHVPKRSIGELIFGLR